MRTCIVLSLLCSSLAMASGVQSPYTGQQHRQIKSLSQPEIDGYLAGSGMGFAKSAELNHYPGPKHVLELQQELGLSERQVTQTKQIFADMQARASKLGQQLVNKESELDLLFADNAITTDSLKQRLAEISELQAAIRYAHLEAHLRQKPVLTRHQSQRYDQLRGYAGGHSGHEH